MLTDGLVEVSVFSTCSTFVMPWSLRSSDLRMVMASAVSALTRLIMEPVTTISCSSGVSEAEDAGACCAMAGIDRAATHAHIDNIMNRFTSDPTLICFRILIFVSPEVSYRWRRACKCARCVVATYNTNERRSDAVDDSLSPTDENENGMKGAGGVMKTAGSVMKVKIYLSASYIDARVVANEALLLNVSRR